MQQNSLLKKVYFNKIIYGDIAKLSGNLIPLKLNLLAQEQLSQKGKKKKFETGPK
jgi:hypothetical protein